MASKLLQQLLPDSNQLKQLFRKSLLEAYGDGWNDLSIRVSGNLLAASDMLAHCVYRFLSQAFIDWQANFPDLPLQALAAWDGLIADEAGTLVAQFSKVNSLERAGQYSVLVVAAKQAAAAAQTAAASLLSAETSHQQAVDAIAGLEAALATAQAGGVQEEIDAAQAALTAGEETVVNYSAAIVSAQAAKDDADAALAVALAAVEAF